METKTHTVEFKVPGIVYLVIGMFLYWWFWGVPTLMTAIPFVAMMFLWPLYLLWLAIKWGVIACAVFFVGALLVLGLIWGYEKLTGKFRGFR